MLGIFRVLLRVLGGESSSRKAFDIVLLKIQRFNFVYFVVREVLFAYVILRRLLQKNLCCSKVKQRFCPFLKIFPFICVLRELRGERLIFSRNFRSFTPCSPCFRGVPPSRKAFNIAFFEIFIFESC